MNQVNLFLYKADIIRLPIGIKAEVHALPIEYLAPRSSNSTVTVPWCSLNIHFLTVCGYENRDLKPQSWSLNLGKFPVMWSWANPLILLNFSAGRCFQKKKQDFLHKNVLGPSGDGVMPMKYSYGLLKVLENMLHTSENAKHLMYFYNQLKFFWDWSMLCDFTWRKWSLAPSK